MHKKTFQNKASCQSVPVKKQTHEQRRKGLVHVSGRYPLRRRPSFTEEKKSSLSCLEDGRTCLGGGGTQEERVVVPWCEVPSASREAQGGGSGSIVRKIRILLAILVLSYRHFL